MKQHMPVIGVGPLYVVPIAVTTVLSVWMQSRGWIPQAELPGTELFQRILAVLLTAGGLVLWIGAVLAGRIGKRIVRDELVTTGVYGWVRNPIYTAFLFWCWAALLWQCNLFLWILGLLHWLYMTLLMKFTEENWLEQRFGDRYRFYRERVNRCIPWPPCKELRS